MTFNINWFLSRFSCRFLLLIFAQIAMGLVEWIYNIRALSIIEILILGIVYFPNIYTLKNYTNFAMCSFVFIISILLIIAYSYIDIIRLIMIDFIFLAQINHSKSTNKQLVSFGTRGILTKSKSFKSLDVGNRFLDLIDIGYFVLSKTLKMLYVNNKGLEIMNSMNEKFNKFITTLVDVNNTENNLLDILKTFSSNKNIRNNMKAMLKSTSNINNDALIKVVPFSYYKIRLIKLKPDYVLMIMTETSTISDFTVAKNLENAVNLTISHELRTLLNGVVSNLDLLENGISSKYKLYYHLSYSSSELLTYRLNDFFDYILIQENEFKLHKSDIELNKLVLQITQIVKWIALQKRIKFTTYIDPEIPNVVLGDMVRITQILLNLISKSIEYTDYGEIRMEISEECYSNLVFKIKCIGAGIHYKLLSQINNDKPHRLKNYYRDSPNNSKTSLENIESMYLEISQLICKKMNSEIVINSKDKKYSEFVFTLPDMIDMTTCCNLSKSKSKMDRYKSILINANKVQENKRRSAVVKQYLLRNYSLNKAREGDKKLDTIFESVESDIPSEGIIHDIKEADNLGIRKPPSQSALSSSVPIPIMHKPNFSSNKVLMTEEDSISFQLKASPGSINTNFTSNKRFSCQFNNLYSTKVVDDSTISNIMVVDDNFMNRFALKSIIAYHGYSSIEVQDGADAVNIINDLIMKNKLRKLLLIFMDLQMPIMNGIDSTIEIIKICKEAKINSPPIIGVSSDPSEENRREFENAGIQQFFNKPLTKQKVKSIFDTYISSNFKI